MELILGALILGGFFLFGRKGQAETSIQHEYVEPEQFENPVLENDYGLPDIHPNFQYGPFIRTYDDAYFAAAKKWRVPFALIKAHALRESNQNPQAKRVEKATSKRPESQSYGLMQPLWWKGSNRLKFAGWPDSKLGDGSILYDPDVNAEIGAAFIADNLDRLDLRDAVNAYNTGVAENVRQAPGNYVNDVLDYYSEIIGQEIPT